MKQHSTVWNTNIVTTWKCKIFTHSRKQIISIASSGWCRSLLATIMAQLASTSWLSWKFVWLTSMLHVCNVQHAHCVIIKPIRICNDACTKLCRLASKKCQLLKLYLRLTRDLFALFVEQENHIWTDRENHPSLSNNWIYIMFYVVNMLQY